jgi:hypothetical protein
MKALVCALATVATLTLGSAADAATFRFDTDPFAGSNASDPGRQIVGGEDFITFDILNDVFSLESTVFGLTGTQVDFFNGPAGAVPPSGVNVVVLQTFDNDNDPITPFAAGTAANLIASRVTTPGPGFFIYFNSGLDLPRLVFSTDLSDNTADLKILFRLTNLSGQAGRDAVPSFSADNFEITAVPEPTTLALAGLGLACGIGRARRRRT